MWLFAAVGCGGATVPEPEQSETTQSEPGTSTGPVGRTPTSTGPESSSGPGDPGTTSTGTPVADEDSGDPPIKLDVGGMPDGGGACPVISVESEPMAVPSDIIIAVDTSGSMNQEAQDVQNNLNMFSQQIVDAGVDARVVLISEGPGVGGICIEPPLGGGGCPVTDDNVPLFLHVDTYVGSTNAYDQIINTYPQYQMVLRPDAVKQLLIVTDDNSWMSPQQFDMGFVALDPITHIGYTQHGIVSMQNCPAAAQVGQAYMDLAMSTGGTVGDLCLQDFQPVFDELATAVVDNAVPCTYDLPTSGGGPQDPSTAEVDVDFGDGMGVEAVERVETLEDCDPEVDGWFFDDVDDPTKIIFCPQTCLRLKQGESVTVAVGISCGSA
ncbi:MAG: hypothetical protein AAGF11_54275 [Myxococcota bacterium]